MSESNSFNEFFTGWFGTLEKGLEKLDEQECACLFSECGKTCAWYVVNYIYKKLFDECEGDLDRFFSRLHEIDGVDGKVIEPGRVYELIFKKCECPVHTDAKLNTPRLCTCSKESMICVFRDLVPDREFNLEQISTILAGADVCRHRITFDG